MRTHIRRFASSSQPVLTFCGEPAGETISARHYGEMLDSAAISGHVEGLKNLLCPACEGLLEGQRRLRAAADRLGWVGVPAPSKREIRDGWGYA